MAITAEQALTLAEAGISGLASGFDHATRTGDNTFSIYFKDGSHIDLAIPIPEDGKDGESAYEIAVKLGFVGTEEEFIESLHGEQGERGLSIANAYFDADEKLVIELEDGTTLDPLTLPTAKVEVSKAEGNIIKQKPDGVYAPETDLSGCVKKETGKGLSTNDYTNDDKAEVEKVKDKADTTEVTEKLSEKVDIQQDVADKGKALIVGEDGKLELGYAEADLTEVNEKIDNLDDDLGKLANVNRRQRRDITANLSNLSNAIAEQNLEKYGYTIGDYFIGASGYKYHLADLDTYYGGYNSYGVVGTHHIGIVVDTGVNTAWLSSGTVTSYNKSTLHALLTSTVLDNVKSDITALFGNWSSHLLAHQMLDNAVGGWGDTWVADTYIKAMSEVEIYGSTVFSADGFQTGIANKKLSIFNKFKYNEIFGNKNIWLKSLSSASNACAASHYGNASGNGVSSSFGAVGLILFY